MLYVVGTNPKEYSLGVAKKVCEQIKVFNKYKLNCELFTMSFYSRNDAFTKIAYRFPFFNAHKKWNIDDLRYHDCLYIRRLGPWDEPAVRFFRQLKKDNPCLKIVYELPTYPYEGEFKSKIHLWPLLIKDRWNRRYIYKFIDRIATLTDDNEIFGVPTLKIGNGIDLEQVRLRKVRETKDIHAIAVANFEWWHGYDRFIEGLKSYYTSNPCRKIYFHMVGHGSEFERYQRMVVEYGLRDYVILHDQQTGEALDDIYDKCNLGIASLGCYRKGMNETQELKSREYVVKGLPFVASVKISDISAGDKESIYLQVPNDNSPVDIEEVINFYDRTYIEGADNVNNRLRQFAKDHFSMEVAMKEVIDYFKAGK